VRSAWGPVKAKNTRPRWANDFDFYGLFDFCEESNQSLQTESLQTIMLQVGHPRLGSTERTCCRVLLPMADQRQDLAPQLALECGNRILDIGHSAMSHRRES
jgi:hypothetical protein